MVLFISGVIRDTSKTVSALFENFRVCSLCIGVLTNNNSTSAVTHTCNGVYGCCCPLGNTVVGNVGISGCGS